MAILQSCCFWKTVRKGSYASAFYTLVYFGFSSFMMLIYVYDEQDFLAGAREQPVGESILARGDITTATVIFNILFLCCSVLLVVASVLVLLALRNDRRELLLPWVVLMLCDVLIELSHLIYLSFMQIVNFDPIVGFLFTIDFFIMCLNSYCLLCVISQYQNYRQGHGYNAAQMRTEVVLQLPSNETTSEKPTYLQLKKTKKPLLSPYITTNAHTHISTIPEENDQNHKFRTNSAEALSRADDDSSPTCVDIRQEQEQEQQQQKQQEQQQQQIQLWQQQV